jgi:hypothetical protein
MDYAQLRHVEIFRDSSWFKSSFENCAAHNEWQRAFFRVFLETACRNEANNMPLERYRRGTTFSYVLFSLIRYGLRAVLNLLNHGNLFF